MVSILSQKNNHACFNTLYEEKAQRNHLENDCAELQSSKDSATD